MGWMDKGHWRHQIQRERDQDHFWGQRVDLDPEPEGIYPINATWEDYEIPSDSVSHVDHRGDDRVQVMLWIVAMARWTDTTWRSSLRLTVQQGNWNDYRRLKTSVQADGILQSHRRFVHHAEAHWDQSGYTGGILRRLFMGKCTGYEP